MFKKMLRFVVFGFFVMCAAVQGETWNIGPNGSNTVTATLVDGTLTVRGTGNMRDFSSWPHVSPPWNSSYGAVDDFILKVIIEDGVTSIGNGAFLNCRGLNEVTIGNSVTTIGREAFAWCSGLTEITIPNSVTEIGDGAFSGCLGLRTINYNATNVPFTWGGIFWNAGTSGEGIIVNIGNNVTNIPNRLFFAHWDLDEDTSPNITSINFQTESKVETIGDWAFRDLTRLTEITIPNSVTTIGFAAFSGCTGLRAIVSLGRVPPTLEANVFHNVNLSTACLNVPQNSIAAYRAASQWGDFLCINGTVISIASRDRIIPDPAKPDTDSSSIAHMNIIATEFTAGPNPVSKHSNSVSFFWQGYGIENTTLFIYDVSGNFVKKISITDNAIGNHSRRPVGSWNLTDSKNRLVSEGTYVVRGTITTTNGRKERISLIIGVR